MHIFLIFLLQLQNWTENSHLHLTLIEEEIQNIPFLYLRNMKVAAKLNKVISHELTPQHPLQFELIS